MAINLPTSLSLAWAR